LLIWIILMQFTDRTELYLLIEETKKQKGDGNSFSKKEKFPE